MTDQRTDVAGPEVPAPRGHSRLGWALVLISVAQLMVVLDGTIVNIALPYIQTDLGIATADLRWVVTGYALAFGSLLLRSEEHTSELQSPVHLVCRLLLEKTKP